MLAFIVEVIVLLLGIIWEYMHSLFRFIVPYPKKNISGEIILVTGAAHGIGRQLAFEFSRYGATLVLWDVNKDGNEATAEEIKKNGGSAYSYLCDVSNVDDVKRVADRVRRDIGDVSILVNNAGILHGLNLMRLTDQQIQKTMEVNTIAHFWTVREFLPKMLEKNNGHIVTIASVGGIFGASYLVDYCTSKFAVMGFTESLREEMRRMGKTGIKLTAVCPFFVNTGMTWYPKARFDKILTAEEVAVAAVNGVMRNARTVMIPKTFGVNVFLKGFFPYHALTLLADFMGSKIELQVKEQDKED